MPQIRGCYGGTRRTVRSRHLLLRGTGQPDRQDLGPLQNRAVVMSAIVRRRTSARSDSLLLSATVVGAQSPASSPQAPAAQKPPPGSPSGKPDARELANQVNNPAAPVTLIQFRNILLPTVETSGVTNEFQLQPVLPIGPFASSPRAADEDDAAVHVSATARRCCGVGDLQVFDLCVQRVLGSVGVRSGHGLSDGFGRGAGPGQMASGSRLRADLHTRQEPRRWRRVAEPVLIRRRLRPPASTT